MEHHDFVFFSPGYKFFVEGTGCRGTYRIKRVGNYDELRLPGGLLRDVGKIQYIILFGIYGIGNYVGSGKRGPHGKHGIPGVGNQHRVAGIAKGKGNIGHALLCAVYAGYLSRGKGYAVPPLKAGCKSSHKLRHVRQCVLVVIGIGRRFGNRLHDIASGLKVRGPHGKIKNLTALFTGIGDHMIQDLKYALLISFHSLRKPDLHGQLTSTSTSAVAASFSFLDFLMVVPILPAMSIATTNTTNTRR